MNTEIKDLKNIITGLRENNNTSCTCKFTRDCEQICNGKNIRNTTKSPRQHEPPEIY